MQVKMYYVGASTCIFEIDGELKLALDPALAPINHQISFKSFMSTRLKKPKYTQSIFRDIDVWLITHNHEDHLDDWGKKIIDDKAIIICDGNSQKDLENKDCVVLNWGDEYSFEAGKYSVQIKSIPAYHGNSFIMRTLVGKVNGYLVEISDGISKKTIYVTGDTVYHEKIFSGIPKQLDILIVNLGNVRSNKIGGPLTMNLAMLDKLVTRLKPKKVIPIHIDDFSHYQTTEQEVILSGYNLVPAGAWTNI